MDPARAASVLDLDRSGRVAHLRITAPNGEDIPLSAQWPETTILVAVD
jgi:hypothetical protein